MSRTSLLLAVAAATTAVVTGAGIATAPRSPSAPPPVEHVEITAAEAPAAPRSRSAPVRAAAVLRAWDAERALAWARGDVRAIVGLYTAGSAAGRHDAAMLRSWTARGLVVRGLMTQLLAVREIRRTASTWTLRVTDRMAAGTAVGPGISRGLPADEPTTRTVRLRLVDGRWRVESVTGLRA